MLQRLTWLATDQLTRAQLEIFHAQCDQISLNHNDRRRVLELDDGIWTAWQDFLASGPLPAEPPLPEMLRRLATATFRLSVVSDVAPGEQSSVRGASYPAPRLAR